jgi:DNA replication and repair protein RecF
MLIQHLSLTNFRNYARLELDLPAGPILILGDNAQGKTSLLEAIYYLATTRSPHTASPRQLIHWLAGQESLTPAARIVAHVARGGSMHTLDATLMLEPAVGGEEHFRKQIKVDGMPRRAQDVAGQVTVVMFLPQDVDLVGGSPFLRRRYLDAALEQVDAQYHHALSQFEAVLPQRNALLKQLAERGGDPDELAYWDEQLAASGALITLKRQQAVMELGQRADVIHRDLTGGQEHLLLRYEPGFDPGRPASTEFQMPLDLDVPRVAISDLAEAQASFRTQLEARRDEEIARGVTLVGPHRDEMRFSADGIDLGVYGSRGQQRTAVLALKLAEVEWMRDRTGEWPVLLLDEVMAELDARRRAYLLARVNGANQSLLTSTGLELFGKEFCQRAKILRVAAGQISDFKFQISTLQKNGGQALKSQADGE